MENRDYWKDFQETPKPKTTNTQPVNPEMAQQFSQVDQQKDQEIGREIAPEKQELKNSKDTFIKSAIDRNIMPDVSFLPNWNINIKAWSTWEKTAKYMLEKNLITSEQLATIISQSKANWTQIENNNNATA